MCRQSQMVDWHIGLGVDSEEMQSDTHLLEYHEIHVVSISGEKNCVNILWGLLFNILSVVES